MQKSSHKDGIVSVVVKADSEVQLSYLQPLHGRRQRQEASRLEAVGLLGSRRLSAQLLRDGQLAAHIAGCSTVFVWSCLVLPVLRPRRRGLCIRISLDKLRAACHHGAHAPG